MNQGISARIMHKLLSLFVILTTLFNPVLAVVATAAPAASPESQDSPILPNASVLRDAPAFQGRPQIQTDKPAFRGRPQIQTDKPAFRGRPQIQTDKPAFRGRPQPIPEALPPDEDFVEIPQYSPEQAWDELDLESPLPTNAAGLDPDATLDEQPAWLQALYSQAVGRDNEEFHVVADSAGGLQAKNTAHGLNSSFGDGGFRVQSGNDFFQLRLRQYGYGATLFPVQTATPQVDGNRVEYLRGDLTEWYLNGPLGLEQGFTLDAPPPTAEGPLTLLLDLSSSLQAQVQADKRGLSLNRAGGSAALTYSGLTAYDADGQELDTWLELATSATAETQLLLRVDDTGAVYPLTIDPWVQIARFMGRGTQSEYFAQSFGEAVAVSADSSTIVVGAYRSGQVSSSFISHTGAVYVFAQPPGGWSNTPLIEGETAKLSALDGEDDDEFGGEVAVSADGSVIVVGAESADSGSSGSGSAYVFERPGGGWSTTATTPTLLPSEASYGFGRMVDVSADGATIIVGGGAYGGPRIIHVFERPGGDWSTPISQTANIVGPLDSNEGADFGSNVAIDADGSTIIVGAARTSNDGIDFTGAVHVFERPVSGWMITPTLTAKLTASDKANQDLLGEGVDISGDGTVIVAGSNVDSIYVFERPGGNWITGTEVVSFDVVYCDETQFNHERNHVVIASDGNTIVVGDQCANSDEGMLYAFERVGGWITATQVATLTSSHPNLTRLLGDAVAINADGSLIFTGGQGAHEYAHVFERSGGAWASSTQTGMLLPSDWRYTDSYFGESIAKSADDRTIVVGAPNDVNELTWVQGGSAYVFEQQGAGWSSAVSVTQLFSSDGADDDNFGKAVDVSADGATIVVGAYADDNDYGGDFAGSAYVFERPGGGWTTAQPQTAKLTASNAGGNDWFGGTIGIDADASTIVVGAYGQDSYDGSALVFERPGGGWITATQTAKLTASDGAAGGDNFGYAVDISADDSTIVVGSVYDDDNGSSSGSAYVFEQPGGGWITATQTTKLLPSDGAADDRFGSFVAINADGAAIVVGVYRDDDNGTESGSAYVFERAGGGWSTPTVAQTTKLLASDGVADDRFGSFVAINADGTAIVVGAPYDDDNAAESGSVYLFDRPGGGWLATTTELAKHVPPDIDSYDYFGSSGAIGGDTILVVATQMHTTIGTVFVLGHNTSYAPIFSSSPVTTAIEDSAYVYDITTDDADSGDVLTITALISPTWLSLVDHGDRTATLSGTPLNAHVGTHNVTLQVSDGISSITQVFVITVTNTNDAPTFSSSPGITATIDQPYNYDITIQDDDGDSVTITDLTKPAWLTLIDDGDGTGSLSGTPSDDDAFPPCGDNGKISSRNTLYGYSPSASGTRCGRYPTSDIGSHSVILEVTDGLSTTAQAFSIQVTGSELSFSSSPVTAAVQDQPYAYDVSASTPGGGVLTFTATLKPAWLTFVDNGDSTARLSGTPTGGELGTHSVNLQVTDGTVTADQAFTITVGTEYPFLLFTTSAATGATQEQDYTYTVTVAGPSGSEPWQINAPLLPAWLGLYDRGDGTAILSGIPRNAHVGSHRVALMARDGLDDTAIQIFDIGVQNVNDAPTFLSSAIKEADEDALYQYTVVAEDIDVGETPILAAQSKPAWLSFVDNGDGTGLLSGTPANADVGDHTVHLTARDPVSATATQIFILTVRNVNDAPVFTSTTPITSIDENTPYAYEIGASDDDVDDVLSFTGITLPSWLAVYDRGDGTAVLHGDPTKDDLGDHAVTLQVQDAALAATTQSFTVTVNNVNDPPEFSSRPSKVAFLYQAYAYDITASDVDIADVLTIEATQKPTWLSFGTLQRAAGTTDTASLNGTPGVAELGVHNISLLVSDAAGLTTTQPYTLTVVNRVPITHVDFVEVYTNQVSIAISVLDNDFDPDGELLSLVSFSQPLTGTTALSGSDQIVYTLFPGFTGDDPFTYQVSDGLDQVTGHVKVRVVPYHNAPILKPDTATAYENMPIRIPILDNDRDPEGTALQIVEIEKLSGPGLSAIIAGDGSDFTFTGFGAGTAVLRYTAQDAGYDIASPRLASTLVTVTVHAYDPGATVASAISGLSNVSMDSGETVELGGRIVLQNTSNNAGRFSFEYALESGSVTPIVLNMGAIPEQGSCQVDFGNNSIACDLGAIAGQSEAAVVISATVQAHGLGNFRQAATMKSSNPGGYHSTSPYVYVVSGGRETRNIRPDLTITADAYEEPQPDGSIKAIGKIQLGEHFIVESYGSFYSPYLTYATDGSFEGEGQVRYVGGRPGYKLGRFIRGAFSAAASADEFVPQAGATLYLWGWFNFYNIQLDGLNLSTGLVRGNADVSFWKRGSDVDPPLSMDIEQMPDGLQSATVHAPSAVKYGSGGLTLKDINLEMMFKEVYYLAGTATLHLRVDPRIDPIPLELTLGSDGTLRGKYTAEESLKFDFSGEGKIVVIKPTLDNTHFFGAGGTIHLPTGKVVDATFDSSWNYNPFPPAFGGGGDVAQYNEQEQKLRINLPQNTNVVFDNFVAGSDAANPPLSIKVADFELTLESPKLLYGELLQADSASLVLPSSLGGEMLVLEGPVKIFPDYIEFGGVSAPTDLDLFDNWVHMSLNQVKIIREGSAFILQLFGDLEKLGVADANAETSLRIDVRGRTKFGGGLTGLSFAFMGMEATGDNVDISSDGLRADELGFQLPMKPFGGTGSYGASIYNFGVTRNGFEIGGGKFRLPNVKIGGFRLATLMGELKPAAEQGVYDISVEGGFNIDGSGGKSCLLGGGFTLRWDRTQSKHVMYADASNADGAELHVTALDGSQDVIPLTPEVMAQPIIVGGERVPSATPRSLDAVQGLSVRKVTIWLRDCEFKLDPTIPFVLTRAEGSLILEDDTKKVVLQVGLAVGKEVEIGSFSLGYPLSADLSLTVATPYRGCSAGASFNGEVTMFDTIKVGEANANIDCNGFEADVSLVPRGPLQEAHGEIAIWGPDNDPNMAGRLSVKVGVNPREFFDYWPVPDQVYDFEIGAEMGKFNYGSGDTAWGFKGWVVLPIIDTLAFYIDTDFNLAVGGDVKKYQLVTRNRALRAWEQMLRQQRLSADQGDNPLLMPSDTDLTFVLPAPGTSDMMRGIENGPLYAPRAPQDMLVNVDVPYATEMFISLASETPNLTMTLIAPDSTLYGHDSLPAGITYGESTEYYLGRTLSPAASLGQGQLRVVHAVSDGAAMDVLVDDVLTFSGLTFTDTAAYQSFAPGSYTVKFVAAGTTSPVLAETFVNLGVGLDYTVLAVGSTSEMDAWKVQDDNAPRGMPNRAYLRMLNAADGFTVTLKEMMGQERYTGIAYLDIGDYVKATAKTYNLQVLDSATGRNLDMLMQQTMDGGAIYTLFVFNSPTASDKVSAVLVQDTAPTSRLGVAYAAGSLANLTLEVDGSTITTTLSPGDRVDVTGLLSGSHSIEVKQGVTTLLSETLHASGQGVYALALFEDGGIVSSSLLENTHVPDGASSGNDGQTGLRVVHLGSGTGAVDVVLTHPSPCLKLPIASNVAYNTVSDNVDVAGLTETYTATVYDAGTANAVYTLTNLLLQPGDNATLYLIDQGGVPVLAYGVDIQMAVNTFAFYEIDAADVGQWQVHLHGDTAGPDNYTLAVDGKRPAPALSNVHIITPSVLEWQLVSPAPDTTIKVFYQTEPITDIFQGRPLSNTLNAPLNPSWTPGSTEPYYDAAWTDGTLQTYTLPLNLLPSGTYYLYLEADSAGGGIARTAVPEALVVTHPWNDPWVAGLALSQEGYGQVTARWNDIGNPEVDEYSLVYASSVTTWTQSAEIQTAQGRTELTVGSLIPGQTYTFTVDVINYREGDTERVAHSESVAVTIEGAVFDLVAPGTPVTAPAGQDIVAVVTLQTALDPYPGVVWLYEGPHSDGIHLDLDTDSFTPTVAGASVPVTISVDASVAQGTYTVTVIGKGGGESSSDVLTVDVTAPSFALQTSESSSTLNENGVVTLTISANRLDGHTAPIWLEVLDSPSALSLLPDEAILVAQTKDLTIADMSYIEGGVYTYTIRGYDGINDVFITQTIEVVKAHYRVTASQSRITATLNASNTIQVPLDVSFAYGWDAPVTLMMGPQYAPPFGRVGFVTTSVPAGENLISLMTLDAPGQVTLHVETLDRTPPGTYIMPVLAESDGLQKEIEIWLRVGEETSPGLPYDIYLPLVLRNS